MPKLRAAGWRSPSFQERLTSFPLERGEGSARRIVAFTRKVDEGAERLARPSGGNDPVQRRYKEPRCGEPAVPPSPIGSLTEVHGPTEAEVDDLNEKRGDDKVDAALAFAARAHRGQLRKGTDIPYIAHPAAVAAMLARAGCEEDLVAAGALHDVVEDTKYGFADIEARFGRRVAGLVRACTERDKSRRSWEERRRDTLEMLEAGVDADVAVLMCADKLHNARSMLTDWQQDGDALWTRFNRGKERQRWYLRGLADAFDRYEGELFREYRATVDELFPPDEKDDAATVEQPPMNPDGRR